VDAKLPDKQYMKIGEVSRLTALNSSVLRFWETEFAQLCPLKSRTGQRLYTKGDVELILMIRNLLYQEKLTIAGAKSRISTFSAGIPNRQKFVEPVLDAHDLVNEVRQDLRELRKLLG
jgi:DNA-binding transcriptional MerR regulator